MQKQTQRKEDEETRGDTRHEETGGEGGLGGRREAVPKGVGICIPMGDSC